MITELEETSIVIKCKPLHYPGDSQLPPSHTRSHLCSLLRRWPLLPKFTDSALQMRLALGIPFGDPWLCQFPQAVWLQGWCSRVSSNWPGCWSRAIPTAQDWGRCLTHLRARRLSEGNTSLAVPFHALGDFPLLHSL